MKHNARLDEIARRFDELEREPEPEPEPLAVSSQITDSSEDSDDEPSTVFAEVNTHAVRSLAQSAVVAWVNFPGLKCDGSRRDGRMRCG